MESRFNRKQAQGTEKEREKESERDTVARIDSTYPLISKFVCCYRSTLHRTPAHTKNTVFCVESNDTRVCQAMLCLSITYTICAHMYISYRLWFSFAFFLIFDSPFKWISLCIHFILVSRMLILYLLPSQRIYLFRFFQFLPVLRSGPIVFLSTYFRLRNGRETWYTKATITFSGNGTPNIATNWIELG